MENSQGWRYSEKPNTNFHLFFYFLKTKLPVKRYNNQAITKNVSVISGLVDCFSCKEVKFRVVNVTNLYVPLIIICVLRPLSSNCNCGYIPDNIFFCLLGAPCIFQSDNGTVHFSFLPQSSR